MATNVNFLNPSGNMQTSPAASAQKATSTKLDTKEDAFGDTLKQARQETVKEERILSKDDVASKDADVTRSEERFAPVKETKVASTDVEMTELSQPAADEDMVDDIDAALFRAMQVTSPVQPATAPTAPETATPVEAVAVASAPVTVSAEETVTAPVSKAQPAETVVQEGPKQVRTLSLESLLPDVQNKMGKDLLTTLAANNAQLKKFLGDDAVKQATNAALTPGRENAAVMVATADVRLIKTAQDNQQTQVSSAAQAVADAIGTTPVTLETATDTEPDLGQMPQGTRESIPQAAQTMTQESAEEVFSAVTQQTTSPTTAAETSAQPQSRTEPLYAPVQNGVIQPPVQEAQPIAETGTASASRTDYDIPRQIVDQARLIQRGQDSTMVIKLNPEHLGELTLRVSVTGNGAVNASFHSDNATVRGIIENTMVQLKQELQAQGLKIDNVGVYAGLADGQLPQSQDQQNLYQGQAQAGQNGHAGDEGEDVASVDAVRGAQALEDASAMTARGMNTATDEGIDYRI